MDKQEAKDILDRIVVLWDDSTVSLQLDGVVRWIDRGNIRNEEIYREKVTEHVNKWYEGYYHIGLPNIGEKS